VPSSGKIFDTNPVSLMFLLSKIHERELALPDFQRDFVWDAPATEKLIESMCQSFPAGSFLRIGNGGKDNFFEARAFSGAPELKGHQPRHLILDGQQRLSSLYQAIYGCGNYRFFVDLQKVIEDREMEECVFHLRLREGQKRYGTRDLQAATLVFPLHELKDPGGFDNWLWEVVSRRPETERNSLRKKLQEARDKTLSRIMAYDFPVITLDRDTSVEAVCKIFETLNNTGVKLSVFDLLAARFWTSDLKLRQRWETARRDYPILGDFAVDPYYVLQAISLHTTRSAPTCKRKDVLKMQVDQVKNGWEPVVRGMTTALEFLRGSCGVALPDWIPYDTMLVPAAAMMAQINQLKGPKEAAAKAAFRRWFWCSVFSQNYENAPNSQSAKDLLEMDRYLAGQAEPEAIATFRFDPAILRDVTVRQRGLYRGTLCLVMSCGARDLHTGDPITALNAKNKEVDDHHVFPRAVLDDLKPRPPSILRDCILNRTLLDRETNNRIRAKKPSVYLQEIEASVRPPLLREILDSHLLPSDPGGPLYRDDFEAFLDARQALLHQKILEITKPG
jgi:hypothetical protein